MIHRRTFLSGLFSALAAPAIVRAGALMPIKGKRLAVLHKASRLGKTTEAFFFQGKEILLDWYRDPSMISPEIYKIWIRIIDESGLLIPDSMEPSHLE